MDAAVMPPPKRAAPGRGRRSIVAERRCIASGEVRPKAALLRFVVAPDGSLVPDLAERLPGRGLWLTCNRDMIERACARCLFAKAARAQILVPGDLADQVERLLLRRCLDLLGLARRGGQAVGGYEMATAWLAAGGADLLLQACDAAEGRRRKLRALAQRHDVPVAEVLTAAQMGAALGRDAQVHVAIAGGFAQRLGREIARLSAVRGHGAPAAPGEELER